VGVLHEAGEGQQQLSNHSSHNVDTQGLGFHTRLDDIVDLGGGSCEFDGLSGVGLNNSSQDNFLHVLNASLFSESIASVLTSSLGLSILLLLEGTLSLSLSLLVNLVNNGLFVLESRGVKTDLEGLRNAFVLLVLGVDVQPGLGV